jgi:hypothetical protein
MISIRENFILFGEKCTTTINEIDARKSIL